MADQDPTPASPTLGTAPRPSATALGMGFLLIVILGFEMFGSARRESQTYDEANHMLAGYRYWQCGDFGVNPEHPPLVKLLAALPLRLAGVKAPDEPCASYPTSTSHDFAAGEEFVYGNNERLLLFRSRACVGLLTMALAVAVYWAGREMFSETIGLLALAILVFEPTILAHSFFVTTDVGATLFFFLAVLGAYRQAKRPSVTALLLTGLATGLALATKHSAVLLFPVIGLLSLWLRRPLAKALLEFVSVAAVAVFVLWAFYGFRYSARPGGASMTVPLGTYVKRAAERGVHTPAAQPLAWMARAHLLPESYLYGLANVLLGAEEGAPSFLLGELRPTGQTRYFPTALLIKLTIPFLLLATLGIARTSARSREFVVLLLPPAIYLGFAMASSLNVGVRHVLPVFPFLVLFAAVGASPSRMAGGVLVLLHAFSSLLAYPDYLAYSNLAWGGRTYQLLTDSNVDWGQELPAVQRYLQSHRGEKCFFAYFGTGRPSAYGISCQLLPASGITSRMAPPEVVDGLLLISATELEGPYWGGPSLNPYFLLHALLPNDVISGGVLVYRGRFALPGTLAVYHSGRAAELADRGQYAEAIAEARTATALSPQSPLTHRSLARALAGSGSALAAEGELEHAVHLCEEAEPAFRERLRRSLLREISQLQAGR